MGRIGKTEKVIIVEDPYEAPEAPAESPPPEVPVETPTTSGGGMNEGI
jgi:hypothetical protein